MINENNAALGGEALDQELSVDRWERGLLLIDECLNSDKMSSFCKMDYDSQHHEESCAGEGRSYKMGARGN